MCNQSWFNNIEVRKERKQFDSTKDVVYDNTLIRLNWTIYADEDR